jgi:hypothetical protein
MKKVVKVFFGIACIFTGNGITLAVDYVPEDGVLIPPEQPVTPGCPVPPECPGGCSDCVCPKG